MSIEDRRPLTRRSFLSAAGVGAGTLVLRPIGLRAAGDKRPDLSFVVVSDTHVGYRDQEGAARQWAKTADEINSALGDLVLHLGDVVDGGREAQYPVYLDIRKRIRKPVHEIPGNHDPAKLFEKHLGRSDRTVVDLKWLRFLLLNDAHTDSHDGFLTPEQIDWLDRQCADAQKREMFVIVCLHVPVHANRHPDRGWYVKPADGQKQLYETLARHRERVLALYHGHFHNGIRGWNDHGPLHEITFPSVLYNRDRKLEAQKAPGYNLAEFRPGYTLVRISKGTMTLRYQPLGADKTTDKQCPLKALKV